MRSLLVSVVVTLLALGVWSSSAQEGGTDLEWRYCSGDNGSRKYSLLAQITKENVAQLRVVWRRPQLDRTLLEANPRLRPANNFRSTPIMVGGVLYASNGIGLVEAFDPKPVGRYGYSRYQKASSPLGTAIAVWRIGARAPTDAS